MDLHSTSQRGITVSLIRRFLGMEAEGMEPIQKDPSTRGERLRERLGSVRKFMRAALPFSAGVLAALIALILYRAMFPPPIPVTAEQIEDTVGMVMASATAPPSNSSLVYQAIRPSLVLIQARGRSASGDDPHSGSLGSGVVITEMGDILTSLHVVDEAAEILVTFADGSQSPAQITMEQPENDIAVITALDPPDMVIPAVLGNPGAMNIGDEAYAVGNPFGLYGSMSSGVISGFDRSFQGEGHEQGLSGLIQIDSAVNPGNSGGPLLNRSGHVVGIVVGILNPTEDEVFIGIGFAVPITTAVGGMGSPPPY